MPSRISDPVRIISFLEGEGDITFIFVKSLVCFLLLFSFLVAICYLFHNVTLKQKLAPQSLPCKFVMIKQTLAANCQWIGNRVQVRPLDLNGRWAFSAESALPYLSIQMSILSSSGKCMNSTAWRFAFGIAKHPVPHMHSSVLSYERMPKCMTSSRIFTSALQARVTDVKFY